MGSSPDPIPQPPPAVTGAAQTTSNVNTAAGQAAIDRVDQISPWGTSTYDITGQYAIPDGKGGTISVPKYTQTTSLSPTEQNLFNINQGTKQNIAQIGQDESTRIGSMLGTPVNLSPGEVSDKLTQLGLARLQPAMDRDWNDRETTLMNRGIMPGSEGYTREQDAFNRSRNDAYNELVKNSYGQEVQTLLAARNQPINEISALLSGSQVSQPNFMGVPQTQIQPTNIAGITQDAFQNNLANAQMKNSYNNALMGGLFGLGGAGLGMFKFSDRRLKTDVEKVGKTDEGTPIYSYRYKGSPTTEIGFMAQDIEKKVPEAVVDLFGLKAVNYKAAIAGGA